MLQQLPDGEPIRDSIENNCQYSVKPDSGMVAVLGLLRVPSSPAHCKEVVTGSPFDLNKILAERTPMLPNPLCPSCMAGLTGSKGDQQDKLSNLMTPSNSTTHVRQRQENSP